MSQIKIGVLLGDDIGLEVIPVAVKVMDAAARKAGLDVNWIDFPIGRAGHEAYGNTFPEVTREGLAETLGFITGPIGHNTYPRGDASWTMPPLRKHYDLFASVKPVRKMSLRLVISSAGQGCPAAAPKIWTGRVPRSRARSGDVTITAAAPSVSRQQSKKR